MCLIKWKYFGKKMHRYWIVTLMVVARISCYDYDQDRLDEYSDEEDFESSSNQYTQQALKNFTANHTAVELKEKIERLLNHTVIEDDEDNDLSGNDGNVYFYPYETK